jgi:Na+/proline symporter
MEILATPEALIIFTLLVILGSFLISPWRVTADGFFRGTDHGGKQPGLWTLVLSQVTTWIFARSLLTAAILGYYYGIAGALAYTAYYASFLTGGIIVGRLRQRGAGSVQDWLREQFGAVGVGCYNVIIALRLMSEVFANLLVVSLIFTHAYDGDKGAGSWAMLALALAALAYSAAGGLRASLRTDVAQMLLFLVVWAIAFTIMLTDTQFSLQTVLTAPGISGPANGWVLLLVAGLQVISYPVHDPVMMDRGFLADERTTRRAFIHSFWISALCILGFALFGVQAGVVGAELVNGELLGTWQAMFGPFVYFLLAAALLVSAMSTLDSALASASRLAIIDMQIAAPTVLAGRISMAVFMACGVSFLLADTEDLFQAVAVSGTASMFLAAPVVLGLVFGLRMPLWSYLVGFVTAVAGAVAYLYQSSPLVMALFGDGHKYERLLWICIAVLFVGFAAGLIGIALQRRLAMRLGS